MNISPMTGASQTVTSTVSSSFDASEHFPAGDRRLPAQTGLTP
jgi:hypothetical protein